MSTRKRVKPHKNRYKQIWKLTSGALKGLIKWLVRSLLVVSRRARRRARLSKSGFVLPTVAMVSLVVVLLTTAIMIRSFDRSKNASIFRANQAVVNAATPALDRARVKIDELLKEPTLPPETPSDQALYNAIKTNPKYTFGDETRLKLAVDLDGNNYIQAGNTLENDETLTTAWRFPVDTNNNGKFDSFTLYGIYFRTPSSATTGNNRGKFDRATNPLEALAPPMDDRAINSRCANEFGTNARLVGDSGWYQSGSQLKKSFFVYTATVPITDNTDLGAQFETFTGNRGFSALEYQQDRERIPLNHNAVWFNNDLEVTPDSDDFRINGRVHTNGNLLVGGSGNTTVRFYQVSSTDSCFYQEENGKITVGGNVVAMNAADKGDQNAVEVDIFDDEPENGNPSITNINKSIVSVDPSEAAYNNAAYNQRIALMKKTALSARYCQEDGAPCSEANPPEKSTVLGITKYPNEVKNKFLERVTDNPSLNTYNVLTEEIELYLKNRTRRVPYAEVPDLDEKEAKEPYDVDGDNIDIYVFANSPTIEPPAEWREPTEYNTSLRLKQNQLEATSPQKQNQNGKETLLGDRVLVGNNLPAVWKDGDEYVTAPQLIKGINWTDPKDTPRYRSTQVQKLDITLGISDRNGFWEEKAVENPSTPLANVGGLRVITGAGVYRNSESKIPALNSPSFLPELNPDPDAEISSDLTELKPDAGVTPGNAPLLAGEYTETPYNLVWPDTMPMTGGIGEQGTPDEGTPAPGTPAPGTQELDKRPPDLRMRATAVYYYKHSSGINQIPFACVSSYYDPTNEKTAKNGKFDTDDGLPWGSNGTNLPYNYGDGGRSNNGVVYRAPYTGEEDRFRAIANYLPELKAQAKMMFPSGRIVNKPLQDALKKLNTSGYLEDSREPLSLSENSAIDTAICALKILDGTIGDPITSNGTITVGTPPTPPTDVLIPHGAIQEASFLDGRQVKALSQEPTSTNSQELTSTNSQDPTSTNYDLELEQRQPLEIRVTEINLDTEETRGITRAEVGTNEYLLPNSGIIYASRDDALRDASDTSAESAINELLSPTDFRLDSTRRPNGIRLVNGSNLSRTEENIYREQEKGLTLVTDLPVYVKGNFNLHQTLQGNTEIEEFTDELEPDWRDFYYRSAATRNPNFACRRGQPGCSPIEGGDTWRPATIISDAITLLSGTFQDGFRDQGDYDLRNNIGRGAVGVDVDGNGNLTDDISEAQIRLDLNDDGDTEDTVSEADVPVIKYRRRINGFFNNNFVTSANWVGSDRFFPDKKTSYLTNGVTPIQRRIRRPEYVMEICRKLPVETCQPGDWFVGYDGENPKGKLDEAELTNKKAQDLIVGEDEVDRLVAGTTSRPPLREEDRRYARRVAFLPKSGSTDEEKDKDKNKDKKDDDKPEDTKRPAGTLERDRNGNPVPLGIDSRGRVNYYPYSEIKIDGKQYRAYSSSNRPRSQDSALWFRTTSNTTDPTDVNASQYSEDFPLAFKTPLSGEISGEQPLLVPVLQIHSPEGNTFANGDLLNEWIQPAAEDTRFEDTTFNATFVAGNSPSRPEEESAGLPNFVRFLENWQGKSVKINGSFIQLRRSAYATAPFAPILPDTAKANPTPTDNLSLFDYPINNYRTENGTPEGTLPYYHAPNRQWSFDVALLSESPDLFAQSFTTPSTGSPNEFFREIGRDDPWIQALLCAATASDRVGGKGATYTTPAIPDRPSTCPRLSLYPANPQPKPVFSYD